MKNISLVIKILFGIYFAAMIWLLFIQRMPVDFPEAENYADVLANRISLVPFRTISVYLENMSWSNIFYISSAGNPLVNVLGNIIMFVPMGFFMCCLWKKLRNLLLHFLWTVAVILIIEFIQLFTLLGSFDVDDIILNVIGSAIGFLIFIPLSKIIIDKKQSEN